LKPVAALAATEAEVGNESDSVPTPATAVLSPALLPGGQLDLNRASLAELEMLPGIGPAKAAAIVEDRERNGPFQSVGDLDRVKGFGAKTVEKLEPYLAVVGAQPVQSGSAGNGPARVRINVANEAELQALHGVGPVLARRIVEHRQRNGPFRGPADLDRVSGVGPSMLDKNRLLIQWD
jgi:competence protein ComEA